MNKEDILAKSRLENQGKPDELELVAMGKASRTGMLIGAEICVVLFTVSLWVLDRFDIASAAWMIYLAMLGSHNLVLYKHLKDEAKLASGIICLEFAVFFLVAFISCVITERG